VKYILKNSKYAEEEFAQKLMIAEEIYNEIHAACGNQHQSGCGSYLMNGKIYDYYIGMYPKQKLLYEKAKTSNSLLEIGTYMGHSLLISLLGNPNLDITCIDISDKYTGPAVAVLRKHFPNAKIEFIHNNSLDALVTLNKKFDLFHIDGEHENDLVTSEFIACSKLTNKAGELNIFFDDVDCCDVLIKNIHKNYPSVFESRPGCEWTNTFLNIKFKNHPLDPDNVRLPANRPKFAGERLSNFLQRISSHLRAK
jgi:hypothetical protein